MSLKNKSLKNDLKKKGQFFLGDRARSRTSSISAPDTEYVILQSNPLLHWVPIQDDFESTEGSSQDSNSQLHRTDSQRSIVSQLSIKSTCSYNRRNSSRSASSSRPSSLLVSPPASPRPAFRSKSIDDNCTDYSDPQKFQKARNSNPNIGQNFPLISVPVPVPVPLPVTAFGKFSKLKGRFAASSNPNPQKGDESDDESTPLVSELSSPAHSNSDSVFRNDFSPGNSSDFSVSSGKSIPKGGEQSLEIEHSDSMNLILRENSSARLLSRQNAEDWENPETPV